MAMTMALLLPLAWPGGDARAGQSGPAKNIILLIGDGMGDSEITAARNYAVGAAGRLSMDTLGVTGEYTTYALQEQNPGPPRLCDRLGGERHRLGDRQQDE